MNSKHFVDDGLDISSILELVPAREHLIDRLADLMLDADEVLHLLQATDAATIRWAEPHLQTVYDEINSVMKRLCD